MDASLIASARGDDGESFLIPYAFILFNYFVTFKCIIVVFFCLCSMLSKCLTGLIRIHTQTWSHFSHTLPFGCTSDEFVIPVRVSSLKAIFFGFTSTKQGQIVNTIQNPSAQDRIKFHKFNFTNMKSAFVHNGLTEYQFFVDGQPQPSTPVRVGRCQNYTTKCDQQLFLPSNESRGSGEHMAELARAVHHGLKSLDGGHLSLLNGTYDKQYGRCGRNQLYGMEFEAFSEVRSVLSCFDFFYTFFRLTFVI